MGKASALVESCGPVQKCCRYTRVAERPKDKVPESKSFGSFETFWIEYVVQTYTFAVTRGREEEVLLTAYDK